MIVISLIVYTIIVVWIVVRKYKKDIKRMEELERTLEQYYIHREQRLIKELKSRIKAEENVSNKEHR